MNLSKTAARGEVRFSCPRQIFMFSQLPFVARVGIVICLAVSALRAEECPSSPRIIKVGVSSYEHVEDTYTKYMSFLSDLRMMDCQKPVAFQVAVGNYGEVLDWWQKGQIDIGIFAAAPVGKLLQSARDRVEAAYVGSVDDTSYWAPQGGATAPLSDYHAIAVVNNTGLGHGIDSIKEAQAEAQAKHVPLRFLFVRPDSASGYLIPKYFLEQESVPLEHGTFSYGTGNSLEVLKKDDNRLSITVAFMYESITHEDEWKGYDLFRVLAEPSLQHISIPVSSVLVNYNLKPSLYDTYKTLFGQLKRRHVQTKSPLLFFVDREWTQRFERIRPAFSSSTGGDPRIPLSEIINDLVAASHCERRGSDTAVHCSVPRLALVLSGGGAKCAYQAGAISAIEDTIENERAQCSPRESKECVALKAIDINLVAGTSGGSINALLVALKTTGDPKGRQQIQKLWQSLDQNTLFEPPDMIRVAEGVFVAALLFWFVLAVVDRRQTTCTSKAMVSYAAACLVMLFLALSWQGHPLALESHTLEHAAMVMAGPSRDGGIIGLGCLALILLWSAYRTLERGLLVKGLMICTALAFLSIVVIVFRSVPALFKSDMIANTVANGVEQELNAGACAGKHGKDQLECVSRQIFDQGLIKRDMVITASRLPSVESAQQEQPDDIYFMAHGHSQEFSSPDPGDPRFVDFETPPNQGRLLSAIVSSSTIYPVFAAQSVPVKTPLDSGVRSIDLVDGGFIHNSPIEAALKWKADRIILIEASPPDRLVPAKNFLDNVGNAFSFLFSQAQKVDTSSRGHVEIYELRPECKTPDNYDECTSPDDQWSMDLFDFTKSRLKAAVAKGSVDVSGPVPRFLRLTGPPQFRDVASAH